MKYCRSCILPDTRPNLALNNDGICNACEAHGTKRSIDWGARELAFRDVVAHAKTRSDGYDCLIPVSGGKDSTWQVVKCLDYGLKPL
ncbi:MAG TPA: N-acetyl sugar amidotransferase, partial [Rhodothermia bacterium]|nr:N-acetyl sugar amidotransferase [Rhodothermia bacterium]